MFDTLQPKNPGAVPPNLPVGEPEDMLKEDPMEKVPTGQAEMQSPATPAMLPSPPSSALDAGVLKPKQSTSPATPSAVAPPRSPTSPDEQASRGGSVSRAGLSMTSPPMSPSGGASDEMYRIKEPSIGKGIVAAIVIAVAAVVFGGGGWWLYQRFMASSSGISDEFPPGSGSGGGVSATDTDEQQPVTLSSPSASPSATTSLPGEVVDDAVLFGAPIDSDSDGLDDVRESQLGTDPRKWDTDGDELSDGDEALGWKTDPLNRDTDGDTYPDGLEVKNGYNPAGPGRFIQPPSATSTP